MIALHTGARVNIQHISSAGSVEAVRLAKSMGAGVTAEVTPHHFTLTEDAVLKYGTLAKMNPPLRTEHDRQALIRGLQDGTIDIIATDHAPHSREEKERPLTEAPSGITGLETSLALAVTELTGKGYLTIPELMEKMSLNPARLYGLDCGRMEAGAVADLVIFHPEEEFIVQNFRSKAVNSPFTGWKLRGRVRYTICSGRIVYENK
jgi:dihydroorotase